MPLMGGWLADKWSFSKCVVTGIAVMFIGYALMYAPTPVRSDVSMMILFAALLLIGGHVGEAVGVDAPVAHGSGHRIVCEKSFA